MADEPPRTGHGGFDPPLDWSQAPVPGSDEARGRPPSAPPPGWEAPPPWAQPPPVPPPGGPSPAAGRSAFLRSRRGMVIAGGVALLLVVAVVGFVVLSRGGDGDGGAAGGGGGPGGRSSAPAATAGRDIALLDGRMTLVAPEGWEQGESSPGTASFKVELRLPGRELVATLILSALPPGGTLDGLLTADGGTRFEIATKDAGVLQATVVPPTGNIRAGASRPDATFFFTLSVFALDAQPPLDGPVLQKLFTEQVAPQLRLP
jgi:hypothetical protein